MIGGSEHTLHPTSPERLPHDHPPMPGRMHDRRKPTWPLLPPVCLGTVHQDASPQLPRPRATRAEAGSERQRKGCGQAEGL